MTFENEEIPCNFVGNFKVGDNLGFNAQVLCKLVELNDEGSFNKMIVLQVGSLLEAALSQIIYRAQRYRREGVPNIAESDRRDIEGKKIDKFSAVIDVLKKYKVLDALGADVYRDLHTLRRYRNKVHIQDDIGVVGLPRDEDELFSEKICGWALALNLRVLKHLSTELARPRHLDDYVNAIVIPAPN